VTLRDPRRRRLHRVGMALTLYLIAATTVVSLFTWATDPDIVRELSDLVMYWLAPY